MCRLIKRQPGRKWSLEGCFHHFSSDPQIFRKGTDKIGPRTESAFHLKQPTLVTYLYLDDSFVCSTALWYELQSKDEIVFQLADNHSSSCLDTVQCRFNKPSTVCREITGHTEYNAEVQTGTSWFQTYPYINILIVITAYIMEWRGYYKFINALDSALNRRAPPYIFCVSTNVSDRWSTNVLWKVLINSFVWAQEKAHSSNNSSATSWEESSVFHHLTEITNSTFTSNFFTQSP
jgi:hypothetical protein